MAPPPPPPPRRRRTSKRAAITFAPSSNDASPSSNDESPSSDDASPSSNDESPSSNDESPSASTSTNLRLRFRGDELLLLFISKRSLHSISIGSLRANRGTRLPATEYSIELLTISTFLRSSFRGCFARISSEIFGNTLHKYMNACNQRTNYVLVYQHRPLPPTLTISYDL